MQIEEQFAGRRVLVMGLGRFGGGVGVTRWLASQGAEVTVTDQAPAESLADSIEAVADLGVTLHLGGHKWDDLDRAELVIVNPAVVKSKSPFFQEVVRRGLPWTTELNLFCERCPAKVIGVTGSFGKSTTCALLAEAFRACIDPRTIHLGGNIGHSLLMELPQIQSTDAVILEMSNAQLEDLPRIDWIPQVAVITNLWPHHLDRYGSFDDYVAAKLNILARNPNRANPGNDPPAARQTVIVGDLHPRAKSRLHERTSVRRVSSPSAPIELRIPGRHNQSNAACVLTVCDAMNLDEAIVRRALAAFPGLPHRIQFVRRLEGVDYFNDSKSTSPSATVVAVESFDRPIVAIVGGQAKEVGLADFCDVMLRSCRAVFCVGECGATFSEALRRAQGAMTQLPHRLVHHAERLEDGLRAARNEARPGDVVLFSPGAPSFDGYANFTQRGDHFVRLVSAL